MSADVLRHPLSDEAFDFGKLCSTCAHWVDTKRQPRTCTLTGRKLPEPQSAAAYLGCVRYVDNGKPRRVRKGQRD